MQTGTGHLVWLGAGMAASPHINFSDYERVTLVDARKKCCLALSKRFPQNNVSILNLTVSGASEESTLTIYSIEAMSALSSATGLLKLYPGLRERAKERVTTYAIHKLVEKLAIEPGDNTLIIDVIDETMPILEALVEYNLLSLFSKVVVTTPRTPLYQGCSTARKSSELLFKNFYKLISVDDTDLDFPRQLFELDVVQQKMTNIEQVIGDLSNSFALNSAFNEKLARIFDEERQVRMCAERDLASLKGDYDKLAKETLNIKAQIEVLKEVMFQDHK